MVMPTASQGGAATRSQTWIVHAQTTQLFSTDGAVFLYITNNGNLILYNTADYNKYGASSAGSIIWQTNTGGQSASQPFQFVMQNVRALLCSCSGNADESSAVRTQSRSLLGQSIDSSLRPDLAKLVSCHRRLLWQSCMQTVHAA